MLKLDMENSNYFPNIADMSHIVPHKHNVLPHLVLWDLVNFYLAYDLNISCQCNFPNSFAKLI